MRVVKLVNAMVTQLGSFASEVTRVARDAGTEGKLGGEARVKGVAGDEARLRALAAGFQMHLPKPVEPFELVVSIASLTRRLTYS